MQSVGYLQKPWMGLKTGYLTCQVLLRHLNLDENSGRNKLRGRYPHRYLRGVTQTNGSSSNNNQPLLGQHKYLRHPLAQMGRTALHCRHPTNLV